MRPKTKKVEGVALSQTRETGNKKQRGKGLVIEAGYLEQGLEQYGSKPKSTVSISWFE